MLRIVALLVSCQLSILTQKQIVKLILGIVTLAPAQLVTSRTLLVRI